MATSHRARIALASLALSWGSALAAAGQGLSIELYPTAAETRAEFEAICRELKSGDNVWFGQEVAEAIRIQLERSSGDPLAVALLRGRLAHELLRLGEPAEALRTLERALEDARTTELEDERRLPLALLRDAAVAHMQLAEDENCVDEHHAKSCILPIAEEAVYSRREHARAAAEHLTTYLEAVPHDAQARWLANVLAMVSGNEPNSLPTTLRLPPRALEPDQDLPDWNDRAGALGVDALDLSGGAVMDDFDGDGNLDLVTSTSDPCGSLRAFRSTGAGQFEDVTARWGLDGQLGGLNLIHADFDGDGQLDLFVLRGGWMGSDGRIRNSLLHNRLQGESRFVDVSAASGIAYPAYPTQTAAWADYDGDGDLDLYVGNEASQADADPQSLTGQGGTAYPSQLFRNDRTAEGGIVFTDVARRAGVANRRYTKGVTWGDYDNDGDPDLYVSNIGPNRLYRNTGQGTFTDVAHPAGVQGPSGLSFATWFFDYDNDGDLDLYVSRYSAAVGDVAASYFGRPDRSGHPALYRNDGNGTFTDVAVQVGLTRPLLPMGANFGDLDNDGWLDLYLGTGVPAPDALMPNALYRNLDGSGFADITFATGMGHLQKGHGIAFGDLDNDGDQDLLHQLGGAFPFDAYGNALFENPGSENAWIVLELVGTRANRFAVGGRIAVETRQGQQRRTVHSLVGSGGSFGGSSLRQEIGLGPVDEIVAVTIAWPGSGLVQRFESVSANAFYRATEGQGALERLDRSSFSLSDGRAAGSHHERHGVRP